MNSIKQYWFIVIVFALVAVALYASDTDTIQAAGFTHYISSLFSATSSLPMRIILSCILGMLLSLTPCIYPMIPITVGILHAGHHASMMHNFLRACAYTIGMAMTYALLGLVSAYTGTMFGSFMSSIWVIGTMILLLVYVTGSMIGLYEMYIPRFLLQSTQATRTGSLLSAFSFGAASGTVASPCLSPGLLLLISLIAKEGNMLAGFLMLFAFGIGLSIPLLLIGTFSSAVAFLPRAGMWMVEIKRLLGFVMLYMCLYLLKPLAPWHIIVWMGATLTCTIGFYYAQHAYKTKHWLRSVIPLFCVLISLLSLAVAYRATIKENQKQKQTCIFWQHDFEQAREQALVEQKKLLLDFTAPHCSICTAIEEKLFCDSDIQHYCLNTYLPVKINTADGAHTKLVHDLHIIGVPTLIIFDPKTSIELKRWGAELYDYSTAIFMHQLKQLRER